MQRTVCVDHIFKAIFNLSSELFLILDVDILKNSFFYLILEF